MFRLYTVILILVFALTLSAQSAFAAIYVKIEGIAGDVKVQDADGTGSDWIEIESVTLGAGQSGKGASGATRRRGGLTPSDISIVKPLDATTPQIFNALTKGMVFPKVIIKHQENSKLFIATYINVQFTGFEQISEDGGWPREHISFTYQKIIWDYSDGKNKSKASWDVKSGR